MDVMVPLAPLPLLKEGVSLVDEIDEIRSRLNDSVAISWVMREEHVGVGESDRKGRETMPIMSDRTAQEYMRELNETVIDNDIMNNASPSRTYPLP